MWRQFSSFYNRLAVVTFSLLVVFSLTVSLVTIIFPIWWNDIVSSLSTHRKAGDSSLTCMGSVSTEIDAATILVVKATGQYYDMECGEVQSALRILDAGVKIGDVGIQADSLRWLMQIFPLLDKDQKATFYGFVSNAKAVTPQAAAAFKNGACSWKFIPSPPTYIMELACTAAGG